MAFERKQKAVNAPASRFVSVELIAGIDEAL